MHEDAEDVLETLREGFEGSEIAPGDVDEMVTDQIYEDATAERLPLEPDR